MVILHRVSHIGCACTAWQGPSERPGWEDEGAARQRELAAKAAQRQALEDQMRERAQMRAAEGRGRRPTWEQQQQQQQPQDDGPLLPYADPSAAWVDPGRGQVGGWVFGWAVLMTVAVCVCVDRPISTQSAYA
jgi:hypothetical protein